ncbi:MAG: hypothetical protein HOC77_03640 [Chloroflexi bacterium]|jgi:hypothetical protein|nr:hypothetical protein [Chloroflexota bacterium]MBT4074821.1 hypothetical protein [Chloroflexota bacterium]MBT4514171.1 hypothetical protein [Chloroflexota bacterium]MBT6681040.1 hypothetical protein [Chloroflexota bacterium]
MTTLATRTSASATHDAISSESVVESPGLLNGADEFSRAVIDSVVNKRGETLSISVQSEAEAISISTQIELLLMTVGMGTGSVSARVAPSFLEHTYPAMHSLTTALDGAGLSGLWTSAGGRCVKLVESWQMFISVDAPSDEKVPGMPTRPNTLLEVVAADQVPTDWFRTRVAPRASSRGLTTVFYSTSSRSSDGHESLFDRVRRSNLTKEWRDGVRRHFDTAVEPVPATAR